MLVKWHEDIYNMVQSNEVYVVDITNVTDWFYQDNEQETYDLDVDFPVLAPPWPYAFIEYRAPKYTYSAETGKTRLPNRYSRTMRHGCFFTGLQIDSKKRHAALDEDLALMMLDFGIKANGKKATWINDDEKERRKARMKQAILSGVEPHWVIMLNIFMGDKHRCKGLGSYCVLLDSHGSPIKGTSISLGAISDDTGPLIYPFAFAINLMHCKTQVEFRDRADYFKLAHGVSRLKEIKYKTLIVKPLQARIKSQGGSEGNVKRAMHFVRGNFAHYGPDNPLFGQHTGTFWRPAHTRGNKKHGEIMKDYKVVVDD